MKNKLLVALLCLCVFTISSSTHLVFANEDNLPTTYWTDYAADGFAGGDGSEDSPYLISIAEQFAYFAAQPPENGFSGTFENAKYYKIISDIDLSAHLWVPININNIIFDGNGHIVSNVTTNAPNSDFQGLFSCISAGKIANLSLSNCKIIGKNYTGLLAGVNYGLIQNCSVTGSIEGSDSVGGLIGQHRHGLIENSFANVKVLGSNDVGGFVGYVDNGNILNSYSRGNVSGDINIGGFVGVALTGGSTDGIKYCYSTGIVLGKENIGTFFGFSNMTTGAVWDNNLNDYICRLGINHSYGNADNNPLLTIGNIARLGVIYDNVHIAEKDIKNKTTQEMQNPTFIETLEADNWKSDYTSNINNGYPILKWQRDPSLPTTYWTDHAAEGFAGGDGSEGNPYFIETAEQLAYLSILSRDDSFRADETKYFKLTSDIDLAGHLWVPISSSLDKYHFDGNGYKIENMQINSSTNEWQGLFAYVYGTVKNLGIVNYKITSSGNSGGLAGVCAAQVENCFAIGTINCSAGYAGGLIGYQSSSLKTINCYSKGTITGIDEVEAVGGLVGNLWTGDIENSYSNCVVKGIKNVGGLVGNLGNEKIISCYSTGEVTATGANIGGLVGNATEGGNAYQIWNSYTVSKVNGEIATGSFIGFFKPIPSLHCDWVQAYPYRFIAPVFNCFADESINPNIEMGGDVDIDPNMSDVPVYPVETSSDTEYMKSREIINVLGSDDWKYDEFDINNGYPILQWQSNMPEDLLIPISKAVRINNTIVLKVSTDIDIPDDNLIHVALYDSNSHLIDYILVPIIEESQSINSFYVVFKDNIDADYLKVFIWKDSMDPLSIADKVPISTID